MTSHPLRAPALAAALCCALGSATAQTQNTTYRYQYDPIGNRTQVTDPLNRITSAYYDVLDRPIRVTDANHGETQYGYDALNQVTQVTDPRKLVTSYTIDGLGNQTAISSPDTGATSASFDAAGNLLSKTDAKGQTTQYQYDALNRLTRIRYADGNTISYLYDQGPNGIGRLSRITDPSGATQYRYDQHGRVLTEERTIGTQATTTSYRYDAAGRLTGLTSPTGRSVDYTRDSMGRISQISTTKDGVTQPVVTQVSYRPFGPVQTFTFGNGRSHTRSHDLDGRPTSYTLNNQAQVISYDAASRITALNDAHTPANSASYDYDPLDRLTSAIKPNGSQSYGYDAVGNRTSQTSGGAGSSYSYGAASNRLTQITGSGAAAIVTDPNGSLTARGVNQFHYDARGRMVSADTASGPVQYQINGLGQRVQKITPTQTTVFHYDQRGKLIAETSGQSSVDYLYLNDLPVATLK